MTYKIAICEDEAEIRDLLREGICKCFKARGIRAEIFCFAHSEDLLDARELSDFHACFLDIAMEEDSLDGITLAHKIRGRTSGREPVIIFISNREDMVYESLKEQPLRFIRKSRFREEIGEAVDAVIEKVQTVPESLTIQRNGRFISLRLSDIFYIESQNRMQLIVTEKETYETYSRFRDFCKRLESMDYLQIHRSYLVNWKYIRSLDAREVILTNGIRLPVSRSLSAGVRERYHQILARNLRLP
ncbi:MAG: LytTR family DNA-binding domain-containing protein [Clostridiales bacterium]|nr:LytTR family DNA-binding domain-containing protein [Clostridiales bacterium]